MCGSWRWIGQILSSFEYNFMIDGKIVTDPNARVITGREKWADRKRAGKPVRGRILSEEFDWRMM